MVISQGDVAFVPRPEQLAPQPKTITPGASFFVNIDFEFNSAVLNRNYLNNKAALGRIEQLVDSLGISGIEKIEVISQSSPEGRSSYNVALSDRRSVSVANYLTGISSSLSGKIKRFHDGESWDQLITCVEQDDKLSSVLKKKIVYVLSRENIDDRKEGVKALGNSKSVGDVYEYLLSTYYPIIRNTAVYLASKSQSQVQSQTQTQLQSQAQFQPRTQTQIQSQYVPQTVSSAVSRQVPSVPVVSSSSQLMPQVIDNTALVPTAVGSSQALVPVVNQR